MIIEFKMRLIMCILQLLGTEIKWKLHHTIFITKYNVSLLWVQKLSFCQFYFCIKLKKFNDL